MFTPASVADLIAMTRRATKRTKPMKSMSREELIAGHARAVTCSELMSGVSKAAKRGATLEEAYAEVRAALVKSDIGKEQMEAIESFA